MNPNDQNQNPQSPDEQKDRNAPENGVTNQSSEGSDPNVKEFWDNNQDTEEKGVEVTETGIKSDGDVVPSAKKLIDDEGLRQKDVVSTTHTGAVSQVGTGSAESSAKGELSTFDSTDEVSEQGAKVLKEQAKAKSLEADDVPNMHVGSGINLMPRLTKEEAKVERRKIGVNIFSAIAILVVVLISLIILGTNLAMKVWLNQEKKQLANLENELYSNSEIIRANNEILARFYLYQDVQEATFSPKEVLIYWRDLFGDFGNLNNIQLAGGLQYEVGGSTDTLKSVAFLWHLLTIDERVKSGNLESFGKGENDASFNFEGFLNFNYFANQKLEDEKEVLEKDQQVNENENLNLPDDIDQ